MTHTAGDDRLRIAMISYYLPSESKIGVGYQVHALANELARRGHTVDIFSPSAPVEGALYGHVAVPLTGPLRTFRFAFAMRRRDLSSYDVLHAHGEDYWMWHRRVPVHIRTLHGSCFEEAIHIKGIREKLRMVLLGLSELLASIVADTTVLISPGTRKWTPWVSAVIPNGVNRTFFESRGTPKWNNPTVLFVGTWNGRKRGADLARIFAEKVRPRVPGATLRMVAQDAPPDVPAGVEILGRLTETELVDEYERAWVFCLPSSYEGFGIPYAEAMAAGLPVIATPNAGSKFVTDHGKYGVLSEIDELGGVMGDLLTNGAARQRLSALARQRSADFDLAAVADQYERLYAARPQSRRY